MWGSYVKRIGESAVLWLRYNENTPQQTKLSTDQEELEDMAREVHHLEKKTRHLGFSTTTHAEKLSKLQGIAHTLELESQKPSEEDTPLTRKIRMLETAWIRQ